MLEEGWRVRGREGEAEGEACEGDESGWSPPAPNDDDVGHRLAWLHSPS